MARWLGLQPADDDGRRRPPERVRLMSTSFTSAMSGFASATFMAAVVRNEDEFRGCLARRFGRTSAARAQVRHGYDQYDAIAVTLVSERISDLLACASAEPERPEFRALLVFLHQRVVE